MCICTDEPKHYAGPSCATKTAQPKAKHGCSYLQKGVMHRCDTFLPQLSYKMFLTSATADLLSVWPRQVNCLCPLSLMMHPTPCHLFVACPSLDYCLRYLLRLTGSPPHKLCHFRDALTLSSGHRNLYQRCPGPYLLHSAC